MRIIPLQTIANQSLSLQLDGINYDLRIHDCGNIMAVDLVVNNIPLLTGARAVHGFPIIPYHYQEIGIGNFTFINAQDNDDEYPYWTRFNTDQSLVYTSPEEIAILNFADYVQGVLSGSTT